jgi:hypothetical protein
MTVNWYDLVSWGVALSGLIAFLYERKKNDKMKHYMAIQGLMQSFVLKSQKYANLIGELNQGQIAPTKEYCKLVLQTAFSESREMVAILLGIMKSLDLKKDLPFDINTFLNIKLTDIPQTKGESK